MTPSPFSSITHCRFPTGKPYGTFRFRAVIDWIELRIVTAQPSNHDTVTRRTGVPYAKAVNPGPGGAATEFLVRIHDPQSWDAVDEMLQRFTFDHPLVEPVTVNAIEIALDAYSRTGNRDDLTTLTYGFYKFATRLVSENKRFSKGKKSSTLSLASDMLRPAHLAEGYNIYIGHSHDGVKQHIYLKETTYQDGKVVMLPEEARRARTEVTFTGETVPRREFLDWRGFEFTALASYFKFRRLKTTLKPIVRIGLEHIDQVGERRTRRRRCGGTREYSVATIADKELNALAYSALRELTKRMERREGKPEDIGSISFH